LESESDRIILRHMQESKGPARGAIRPVFLALENASLRLGQTVVFRGTNWTWHAGEQWAMLGPDGAGKSLLIEALSGRLPLAAGELHGPNAIGKQTQSRAAEAIAHVSPLTQRQLAVEESSFYQSRWHGGREEGQRTVAQFLSRESVEERNPFEVGGRLGNEREFMRRQSRLVRWLGIKTLLPRELALLSNGEMRKALLIHALLKAPRLLILEDPFAGLDAATRRVLHRVIARVIRGGTPALVATNRAAEIPAATTHLLLVAGHQVIAQGPKRPMLRLWRERFGAPLANGRPPRRGSARPRLSGAAPASLEPLVEFHNVSVTSGRKHILRNVTWTLRAGEGWALFGPNGAGKTTLLNLIQGDHPQVYAQNIRLFGHNTDSTQALWQMRQRLGWMSPELHQHYPGGWKTGEVVCSGFFNTIGLYEACSRTRRKAARQWLLDLGLATRANEPFGELTFGQQRLVLLARAAVNRPRLLILDEPCQGLDVTQRQTLLAAVDRVVTQTGASLIFVTHHAKEIPRCITHVLRLEHGRVRDTFRRRVQTWLDRGAS
jgi:molybdate transport system ATP-binding protein